MGCGTSVSVANKADIESDVNKIGREENANADRSMDGRVSSNSLSDRKLHEERNSTKNRVETGHSHETKANRKEGIVEGRNELGDELIGYNNEAKKIIPAESLKVGQTANKNEKEKNKELSKEVNVPLDFTDIDAHALKAPDNVCGSTRELAGYLMKGATNQLQKARSFYKWITENIRYDTESFFSNNIKDVDAESVLRKRTSVCAGYANLYQELCTHAGIKVKVISGYSKGYGYDPETPFGYKYETDHAWNALNIAFWHFVECTWGAGHLDNQGKFQKEYDEFYFLTDPKHFINAHFPFVDDDIEGSKQWQLLDTPFTLEEYSKSVKLSKNAMKWGLKFSHNEAVIHVDKTIDIEMEDVHGKLIDSTIYLINSDRQRCDEYIFFRRVKPNIFKATINLPNTGMFELNIYGKADKEKEKLDQLVMFILKCQSVDPNIQPFPKHSGLWGVDAKAYDIGFQPSVASKISHKALNGKLKLELPAANVPASLLHLKGAKSEENLKRYSLLETNNNGLQIHLRLPRQEFYKLEIFCQTGNSTSYHPVMSFLIESIQSTRDEALPFPETYPHAQEYFCELLEPTTGKLQANTSVVIRFKSPKLVKGFVNCLNYTDLKKTGDVWEAEVTTGESGGGLAVNGNDTGKEMCWGLYKFDIV